jgi:hypothetical protein
MHACMHVGRPPGPLPGTPTSRAVFVMLAMRKSSHEARAALITRRHNAVKPRIHCVLTQ